MRTEHGKGADPELLPVDSERLPSARRRSDGIAAPRRRAIHAGLRKAHTQFGHALCFLLLLTLLVPQPLHADVLQLKNGNEFRGRVSETVDGFYEVFVEPGRVFRVARSEVAKRIQGEAPYDEFLRRFEALPGDQRDPWVELALWAERQRLRQSSLRAFRRVLQIDPHHPAARDRLGYVLFRNRWVLREKLQKDGLVRFRGLWMRPGDVEAIRVREAEAEFRALLADVHADNRYLRENALLTLSKEENVRLLPALKKLTTSREPLERVVAARILGNFSSNQSGEILLSALVGERRDEVTLALVAALRGQRDRGLGRRIAEQLRTASDPIAIQNLLALIENCPSRDTIPALLDLLKTPRWTSLVDRTLSRVLRVPSRDAAAWRSYWRQMSGALSEDLGSGWLRP